MGVGAQGLAAAESVRQLCSGDSQTVACVWFSGWAVVAVIGRPAIAWEEPKAEEGGMAAGVRSRARLLKEMVGVASLGGQLPCTASVARSCRGWEALNALAGARLVSVGPSK